jgi:DNA repair protein RecO (recombination protein O)
MQQKQDFGIMLHSTPYRNTSLIASFLSQKGGYIKVLIRGAKRARKNGSKFNPISCFNVYDILYSPKNDLHLLLKYEHTPPITLIHPAYMFVFMEFNELIIKLLPLRLDCKSLFDGYAFQLNRIGLKNETPSNLDTINLYNTLHLLLLDALGFSITWDTELISGDFIKGDRFYKFSNYCGFVEVVAQSTNETVVKGKDLISIYNQDFNEELILIANRFINSSIAIHSNHKVIKSQSMIQQLHQADSSI